MRVPKGIDPESMVRLIERLSAEDGLLLGIRSTSRRYPGSVHWHCGRKDSNGTLEVTLLPKESMVWIVVHENRRTPWTVHSAKRLARAMESQLRKGLTVNHTTKRR